MQTFLLAWNPKNYAWDSLQQDIDRVSRKGFLEDNWSCGVSRMPVLGDSFYLIRLGTAPKGIIASGKILSEPSPARHWRDPRKKALYVAISFTTLVDPYSPQILPLSELKRRKFLKDVNWETQVSGIRIPHSAASVLSQIWNGVADKAAPEIRSRQSSTSKLIEGKQSEVVRTRYERSARARHECLDIHGVRCSVCDIDFEEQYGEIGRGYIEVHHLRPVSSGSGKRKVNPRRDLRPVCRNCHAMLHKRNPPYTIRALKKMIEEAEEKRG